MPAGSHGSAACPRQSLVALARTAGSARCTASTNTSGRYTVRAAEGAALPAGGWNKGDPASTVTRAVAPAASGTVGAVNCRAAGVAAGTCSASVATAYCCTVWPPRPSVTVT